ncbi:hypothetical protein JKF63_00034 [Porcisia hertigi]|uniref:Uncharacterized protein n=1 Tax=Porcisia hertigi TaxID=2761500 RepID=A0A836HP93_9TRYP|nr:hypothetical protein JKF63_00034 [Porcisia hertigi]
MDFEALLTNDALHPLMSEFALHLMDHPDTASLISRLPAPSIAMLYNTALLCSSASTRLQDKSTQETERLCALVLDTYALRSNGIDKGKPEVRGTGKQWVRPRSVGDSSATAIVYAPLCGQFFEAEGTQPLLEEVLAVREAQLQHCIATLAAGSPPAPSTSNSPYP